jgi:hypothetical protein
MFNVPSSGRTDNIKKVAEFIQYPKKDVLRHWFHRSCDTVFLGQPKLLVEVVYKLRLLRTPTRKSRKVWDQEILGARNEAA